MDGKIQAIIAEIADEHAKKRQANSHGLTLEQKIVHDRCIKFSDNEGFANEEFFKVMERVQNVLCASPDGHKDLQQIYLACNKAIKENRDLRKKIDDLVLLLFKRSQERSSFGRAA